MAIIQAQAKLYQGFRSYVVDKNISANLSASFSIGNKNNPTPLNDLNGNPIIYSGVKVFKIVRTIADLICPRPKPVLVNERYKTYGGGNNVINANGSVDNTNNSKIVSTLVCSFPTYFRLDLEALGLPEGTDCVVKLEEGFVLEDRGNIRNSGTYPYPEATPNANPRNDSFVTFRTPKLFPKRSLSIVSSLAYNIQRIRPYVANLTGAMSFAVRLKYANAQGIFMGGTSFFILPTAVKTARAVAALSSSVSQIINPNRLRPSAVSTNNIVASLSQPSANGRIRRSGALEMPAPFFISMSGDRTLGVITAAIQTTASLSIDIGRVKGIVETTPIVSNMITLPSKTTRIQEALVARANVVSDGSVPMVLSTITYGPNTVRVLPIFYGNVNAQIDWGDGTTQTVTQTFGDSVPYTNQTNVFSSTVPSIKHTYLTAGTYKVTISGYVQKYGFKDGNNIQALRTNNGGTQYKNALLQWDIQSFGYIGIESLVGAYWNHMIYWEARQNGYLPVEQRYLSATRPNVPTRIPNTCKDTSWMFYQDTSDGGNAAPGGNVTWLDNQIANWNTSNVENMSGMFYRCRGGFNTNLSSWNVSKVIDFSSMFYFASSFTGTALQNWNTASSTNMAYMFFTSGFSSNLNYWKVSKVTDFRGMFAYSNPGTLYDWDMSSTTRANMELMLWTGYATSRDLSSWCVTNIPSTPDNFVTIDTFNPDYSVIVQPEWGTCPGPRPIISSITADKTTMSEGENVTFTINVSNITTGTLAWRMNYGYPTWEYANNTGDYQGQTGQPSFNDLGNITSGTISIVNGVATKIISSVNIDGVVEGAEYFRLDILSRDRYITPNSTNPVLITQTPVITISANNT